MAAMKPQISRWRADGQMVVVTLLAAVGWMFSKESLAGMPPLLFIGARFLLAGLLLGAIGWRQVRVVDLSSLQRGVGVGILFAVAMAFWVMGLAHASHLGEGAFISSLGAVLVPVLGSVFFGDRSPLAIWLALPIALLGLILLSLQHGFRTEPGQLYFLAAAFAFALVFIANSHVVRRMSVLVLGAVQLSMVGILLLPVSWLLEDWPAQIAPAVAGWFLASVLLGTTARFLLQLGAQKITAPAHAALILMLEPVWTALLAAVWWGERMSVQQLLGCTLIFVSLLVSRGVGLRGLVRRWR